MAAAIAQNPEADVEGLANILMGGAAAAPAAAMDAETEAAIMRAFAEDGAAEDAAAALGGMRVGCRIGLQLGVHFAGGLAWDAGKLFKALGKPPDVLRDFWSLRLSSQA